MKRSNEEHAKHIAEMRRLLLGGKSFSALVYQREHNLKPQDIARYINEATRQIKEEEKKSPE